MRHPKSKARNENRVERFALRAMALDRMRARVVASCEVRAARATHAAVTAREFVEATRAKSTSDAVRAQIATKRVSAFQPAVAVASDARKRMRLAPNGVRAVNPLSLFVKHAHNRNSLEGCHGYADDTKYRKVSLRAFCARRDEARRAKSTVEVGAARFEFVKDERVRTRLAYGRVQPRPKVVDLRS